MQRYIKDLNVVSVDSVGQRYVIIPKPLSLSKHISIHNIYIHNNHTIMGLHSTTHTFGHTLTTQSTQSTQNQSRELDKGTLELCSSSVVKNSTTLLTTLKKVQNYYMDVVDKRVFTIVSLYTITTYFFELFNSIGYLFFCSDSGSGKTKFADIIRLTSFNSINATNPSESVLFRIIQQTKGTLFVDDYEKIEETKKGAIDQILKVGYKRGGQTVRSEKVGDNYMPRFFDVYSPKVITNTIGLDSITYSRCIPLHLLKTTTNKGRLNPDEFDPMWQDLRDLCYEFAMFNWKAAKEIKDSIDIPVLNNRDLELVKPLLVTAKLFGEDVYEEALKYLLKLFGERDMYDFTDDWDFVMFSCIQKYVGDSNTLTSEWLSPKEIATMMLNVINVEEGNAKPSARWVGRVLSKIELFKKRRKGAGVDYRFDSVSLEKYMKARGWYNKEPKGDDE